jgi:hypothetical protein
LKPLWEGTVAFYRTRRETAPESLAALDVAGMGYDAVSEARSPGVLGWMSSRLVDRIPEADTSVARRFTLRLLECTGEILKVEDQ